jgi:hypothetical protein
MHSLVFFVLFVLFVLFVDNFLLLLLLVIFEPWSCVPRRLLIWRV